jgi:NAD(P)-dependent dehydrogenase (short-subunit alcohol dehydrogenase family)
MIHACLPSMIKAGRGSVVNVASMGGVTGLYDAHAYTAAKGAIVNLTRSMGSPTSSRASARTASARASSTRR